MSTGTQLATWGEVETDFTNYLAEFRNAFLRQAQELTATRSELERELRQQKNLARETLKRLQRENVAISAHSRVLAQRLDDTTRAAKSLPKHRRDLVLLALGGDSAALEVWQELAEQGDTFALELLELCTDFTEFTDSLILHRLESCELLAALESTTASTYAAPTLTAESTRETFPNAPPICAPSARTGQRLSERLKT
jgi:Mn-dependent DtxR family transcriptional regulator